MRKGNCQGNKEYGPLTIFSNPNVFYMFDNPTIGLSDILMLS
jgi:hypothetical protein